MCRVEMNKIHSFDFLLNKCNIIIAKAKEKKKILLRHFVNKFGSELVVVIVSEVDQ